MAMTSEERSDYPLCGAKKKNGEECRAFAGQGTDHKGIGRCRHHFGNSPSHRQNAVTLESRMRMGDLGTRVDVSPGHALKVALGLAAGQVSWILSHLKAFDDTDSPEARWFLKMFDEERDRLARVAKACRDAGLKEAEMELVQAQSDLFGELLEAVMGKLNLSQEQRKAVGPAIREAMAETLAANSPDAGSADPDAGTSQAIDAGLV